MVIKTIATNRRTVLNGSTVKKDNKAWVKFLELAKKIDQKNKRKKINIVEWLIKNRR
jgi:hypothetical protein